MRQKLILFLLFISCVTAYSQKCGIYLTEKDYTNNTPIQGTALHSRTTGSSMTVILTKLDGSKQKFDISDFWGCYNFRKEDRDLNLNTLYITLGEGPCVVYQSGDLYLYVHPRTAFYKMVKGQLVFYVYTGTPMLLAKGPNGRGLSVYPSFTSVQVEKKYHEYFDKELRPTMVAYISSHPEISMLEVIEYYNKLKAGEKDIKLFPVVMHN